MMANREVFVTIDHTVMLRAQNPVQSGLFVAYRILSRGINGGSGVITLNDISYTPVPYGAGDFIKNDASLKPVTPPNEWNGLAYLLFVRYGTVFNLTDEDLKLRILNNGSLPVSDLTFTIVIDQIEFPVPKLPEPVPIHEIKPCP